jgi:Dyp-type peroxidase family
VTPQSWHLAAPHDRQTQGLVVSGFGHLPTGRALFLEFGWPGAGGSGWLKALRSVAPITDADAKDARCAGLGLTWLGLKKMGLDANALASFDRPFKEGMFQEDRLRRLGDRRDGVWQPNVIDGGPVWSGNVQRAEPEPAEAPRAFAEGETGDEKPAVTPVTVHAVLLLYEKDEAAAEAWCGLVERTLAPFAIRIVHRLPLQLRPDEKGIAREHFGFADGISQPVPVDAAVVPAPPIGASAANLVPLGEIVMGFANAHNEIAAGPAVMAKDGVTDSLPPHPRGEGFCDLGLHGSYMVVRELRQDVASFWTSMDEGAQKIGQAPEWIAERVVGRDLNGNLLCPGGVLPPVDGQPDNDFAFFDTDRRGLGCPMGSHVRRGNPRDGLAPTAADKETLLKAANSHRILRRGRKFGPDIADPRVDDGQDRGLLFICLNTDIGRQFEFVQQTWMLNPNFAFLYDETDPLIGPSCTFTIPETPMRRIVPVKTYVQMAGGEYFFLPSLPALDYLEAL